jgi:hypothetical protein
MRKPLFFGFVSAIYFSSITTAHGEDSCEAVCVMPLTTPSYCAAYLPEGWDRVPAGTIPAFGGIFPTGKYAEDGGDVFQEYVVDVVPTPFDDMVPFDMEGFPYIEWQGELFEDEKFLEAVIAVTCPLVG